MALIVWSEPIHIPDELLTPTPVEAFSPHYVPYTGLKRSELGMAAWTLRVGSPERALACGLGKAWADSTASQPRIMMAFYELVTDRGRFAFMRCDYPDKVTGSMAGDYFVYSDATFTKSQESTEEERARIWWDMVPRLRRRAIANYIIIA